MTSHRTPSAPPRGTELHLPRLAAGGRPADAHEQPRPRGRRAPRGPRRLRRHRQGRARLAGVRRDRRARCARSSDDETLLVQSGRPVGVLPTHEWAPRVLIANSNLVGDWATWEEFRRLEALGLTMYGQMTAGSWIYIGTPGDPAGHVRDVRRGRRQALRRHRWPGTLTLTAGLRRHGRRAAARGDDERRRVRSASTSTRRGSRRRIEHGYLDAEADDLDEALRAGRRGAATRGAPLSIGVVGNAAEVVPRAAAPRARRSTS